MPLTLIKRIHTVLLNWCIVLKDMNKNGNSHALDSCALIKNISIINIWFIFTNYDIFIYSIVHIDDQLIKTFMMVEKKKKTIGMMKELRNKILIYWLELYHLFSGFTFWSILWLRTGPLSLQEWKQLLFPCSPTITRDFTVGHGMYIDLSFLKKYSYK